MKFDFAVLGSGPAGLFCAHTLAAEDFSVLLVSPDLNAPWKNKYGLWVDELRRWTVPDGLDMVWPNVVVRFPNRVRRLHRPYARLHNQNIRTHLLGADFERVEARADALVHDDEGTLVRTEAGEFRARIVIDARGATVPENPAAQTAYGISATFSGDPLQGAEMLLMDWRQPQPHAVPSFLYGMRDQDRVFVEETVLTARPPVPIGELKTRLYHRLAAMQIEVMDVEEEERCFIPMNVGRPNPTREIRIGAAGGFIHPATGYSVGRSIRAAAELTRYFKRCWYEDPDTLAKDAYNVVWPRRAVETRKWYEIGHDVLLRLPPDQLLTFFEQFFECSPELWQGYLSDRNSPADVQRLMWQVFQRVDRGLKWQLMLSSVRAAIA